MALKLVFQAINWIPVILVFGIIAFVVVVYETAHIQRLMRYTAASPERLRAVVESAVFHVLFGLFMVSLLLATFVTPGTVPKAPPWTGGDAVDPSQLPRTIETKGSKAGGFRRCKWCGTIKPDRTHHCSRCGRCWLRMDHHCPWINNCIGWRNHKYFFLAIVYGFASCVMVFSTQLESTLHLEELPLRDLIPLAIGEVLAGLFGLVLFGYLVFITTLLCVNMTTIEFCERKLPPGYTWNLGWYQNIRQILGPNPLLWILPIDIGRGTAFSFACRKLDGDEATPAEHGEESTPLIMETGHEPITDDDKKPFESPYR